VQKRMKLRITDRPAEREWETTYSGFPSSTTQGDGLSLVQFIVF
jgi:hypothetical protein